MADQRLLSLEGLELGCHAWVLEHHFKRQDDRERELCNSLKKGEDFFEYQTDGEMCVDQNGMSKTQFWQELVGRENLMKESESPLKPEDNCYEQKNSPAWRGSSTSSDASGSSSPSTMSPPSPPPPSESGRQSPRRGSIDSNFSDCSMITEEDQDDSEACEACEACEAMSTDETSSDDEDTDDSSDYEEVKTKQPRGRRGRSPTISSKVLPEKLTPALPKAKITRWLHRMLESKAHNPVVLRWEDKASGLFRVMNQAELARLWGQAKRNPTMTYEKFSRACRYYYGRNELVIVRRKMFYRFGPKSDFCKMRSNIEM